MIQPRSKYIIIGSAVVSSLRAVQRLSRIAVAVLILHIRAALIGGDPNHFEAVFGIACFCNGKFHPAVYVPVRVRGAGAPAKLGIATEKSDNVKRIGLFDPLRKPQSSLRFHNVAPVQCAGLCVCLHGNVAISNANGIGQIERCRRHFPDRKVDLFGDGHLVERHAVTYGNDVSGLSGSDALRGNGRPFSVVELILHVCDGMQRRRISVRGIRCGRNLNSTVCSNKRIVFRNGNIGNKFPVFVKFGNSVCFRILIPDVGYVLSCRSRQTELLYGIRSVRSAEPVPRIGRPALGSKNFR